MAFTVSRLRQDPRYCGWLLEQDWFRKKHPDLRQIIAKMRRDT
jgi:hypothetical protein